MDSSRDPDRLILESNPGVCTVLAMQLEACMMCDENAQAAYLKIYGRKWIPLCAMPE